MKVGDLARFVKKGFKAKIGDIVLILEVKSFQPGCFTEAYYHYIHQRTGRKAGAAENYLEKIP